MAQRTKKMTNKKRTNRKMKGGYKKRSKKVMKGGSVGKTVATVSGIGLILLLLSGLGALKYKFSSEEFMGDLGEGRKFLYLKKFPIDLTIFGFDKIFVDKLIRDRGKFGTLKTIDGRRQWLPDRKLYEANITGGE